MELHNEDALFINLPVLVRYNLAAFAIILAVAMLAAVVLVQYNVDAISIPPTTFLSIPLIASSHHSFPSLRVPPLTPPYYLLPSVNELPL